MTRNHLLLTALAITVAGSAIAHDRRHRDERLFAALRPTHEVPALSSTATGSFTATLDEDAQTLTYELTYQNLEAAPLQAHIHLGQRGVNGGVSVFLCGNAPNVPPATAPTPPACPAAPATVTGTLTAADIIGPAAQGLAPTTATTNEFGELVNMLRSGVTYANVHSVKYPGGEIRGQVRVIEGRR
jgi:CHRD domain